MNPDSFRVAERRLPKTYLMQAQEARKTRENAIKHLIEQGKWPEDGWDDVTIELFLRDLALMDSNNFPHNVGGGEREGRVFSRLVMQRHYYLSHGVGRSGDLTEVQPKAAGSSLLNGLTNSMLLDVVRTAGASKVKGCFLCPMATGMTLCLCMLSFRQMRPKATCVIWPRIDQKSCFKSMVSAGFKPIVVQNVLEGDELRTDVDAIRKEIETQGADAIAAVMTTTSCFAPRGSDRVEEVALLCAEFDIPHLINNAYGLQSTKCMHIIQEASRVGRVDLFVQSTDKNLMVPVGGTIVAGFDQEVVQRVSRTYPGRASASPSMDTFITLLSMGASGFRSLSCQRSRVFTHLQLKLKELASKYGQKVLETKSNPVSMAMTIDSSLTEAEDSTQIGSMLFLRGVSGARIVAPNEAKEVAGHHFIGWGSHCNNYPVAYLTFAAAIGMTEEDVGTILERLEKVLEKIRK